MMKYYLTHILAIALILLSSLPGKAEEKEWELSLYPNPSQGKFRIEMEVEDASKLKARIYDMTGKLVKDLGEDLKHQDKSIRLDVQLKDPSPGIYFLKLESGREEITKKVIIR